MYNAPETGVSSLPATKDECHWCRILGTLLYHTINYLEIPMPRENKMSAPSSVTTGIACSGVAIGATAIGAFAMGAVAIGALAIRKLAVRSGRIERLSIGELTVDRLLIKDSVTRE